MINKIIGVALLIVAVLVVIGLIIENTSYWFAVDYIALAVCAVSGIALILRKK